PRLEQPVDLERALEVRAQIEHRSLRVARLLGSLRSLGHLFTLLVDETDETLECGADLDLGWRPLIEEQLGVGNDSRAELVLELGRLLLGSRQRRRFVAWQCSLEIHDILRRLPSPKNSLDGMKACHTLVVEEIVVARGPEALEESVVPFVD